PLLESYEICPIPEVVLAAPEDLVDSAQRLSEVCQWLAEAAPT
ncbi:hydrogenase expression/formation protein, partial [Escherichia coli]|nr:hydrogenase expression/formation protein [Escherichia coli]